MSPHLTDKDCVKCLHTVYLTVFLPKLQVHCCRMYLMAFLMEHSQVAICFWYTVFIQIDAHALTDARPHHKFLAHTNGWNWFFFIKNAWIDDEQSLYLQLFCSLMMYLRSAFEPIILYQPHVLLTLSGRLICEWKRYSSMSRGGFTVKICCSYTHDPETDLV